MHDHLLKIISSKSQHCSNTSEPKAAVVEPGALVRYQHVRGVLEYMRDACKPINLKSCPRNSPQNIIWY